MDEETRPHTVPPWGSYPLTGLARGLTAATRGVPGWPLVKQLAFPLRRLARRFMGEAVDEELWGLRLRFHPHGNISERRLLFMPEKWDPTERAFLGREVGPGSTFLDVGCNFGGYTWWLLHLLKEECTVVALEPDPELNARLHFNLETNGRRNVRVLPYAAAEESGTAVLHIDAANRGENTLLDSGGTSGPGVEVPLRTLAEVARETELERIDVLKIDIEGLEPPVLRAFFREADRSLWPRILICERKDTPEHDALEDHIREQGYELAARTRLNMILVRSTDR